MRRGIDHNGNVANFVETEQLLLVEEHQQPGQKAFDRFAAKLSFVQIRGSAPFFWAEVSTLLYKPDLQIMDLQETVGSILPTIAYILTWTFLKLNVLRRHLELQKAQYGEITLVNLVNQVGHEKPVKEAYERYLAQVHSLMDSCRDCSETLSDQGVSSSLRILRFPSRVQEHAVGSSVVAHRHS